MLFSVGNAVTEIHDGDPKRAREFTLNGGWTHEFKSEVVLRDRRDLERSPPAASPTRRRPRDTADTNSDTIQEITVTAQRRTENAQDVPITIQALTGEYPAAAATSRPSTISSSTCPT